MKNDYLVLDNGDYLIKVNHLGTEIDLLVDSFGFEILRKLNRTVSARKCGNNTYFTVSTSGKNKYVHRLFTNCQQDRVVDHINRDTLDNRFCNLRVATKSQNMQNLSRRRGVDKNNETGRWRARIFLNGIEHHLGYFDNEEDAHKVRFNAEKELFTFSEVA